MVPSGDQLPSRTMGDSMAGPICVVPLPSSSWPWNTLKLQAEGRVRATWRPTPTTQSLVDTAEH
ncbi:hypothetical protein T484DRAFT_1943743 [Baffinella frigidus]|nr:hypothetical protein T484DRAFT_1943743 [Cryptophyta sp. CCMP2293]